MIADMPLRSHGIWPSASEELAIRAATALPDEAPVFWQQWLATNDIDRLSFGTFRLLPLLYTKLSTVGYDGPEMPKLRGTYRQSWYRNQLLLRAVAQVLEHLNDRGIESVLLKGIPLSIRTYRDPGARSMGDGDIMVRRADSRGAIALLEELGWVRKNEFVPGHAVAYQTASGLEIDLHWHITKYHQFEQASEPFWSASVPFELQAIHTRALNHTDELLHALIHGMHWEHELPIRWVPDSLYVLDRHRDEIDWDRLVTVGETMRSGPTVLEALRYLITRFAAPVPDGAVEELERRSRHVGQRVELWFRLHATARYPWGSMPLQWITYWRTRRDQGEWPTPWGFVSEVKKSWGVDNWGRMSVEVATRVRRRLRWLINSRLSRGTGRHTEDHA